MKEKSFSLGQGLERKQFVFHTHTHTELELFNDFLIQIHTQYFY